MWNRKLNIPATITLITAVATLTGCGVQTFSKDDARGEPPVIAENIDKPSSDIEADSSTSTVSFIPAITRSFEITGPTGLQPVATVSGINTNTILKVKVTAQAAGQVKLDNGNYSNYSIAYKCVRYTVSALGKEVTTKVLSPSGGGTLCPNAPSSETIDFSDRLGVGHNSVTVEVIGASYDVYCQWLLSGMISTYYYQTYCSESLYPLYRAHTARGSLAIQVNGSSL